MLFFLIENWHVLFYSRLLKTCPIIKIQANFYVIHFMPTKSLRSVFLSIISNIDLSTYHTYIIHYYMHRKRNSLFFCIFIDLGIHYWCTQKSKLPKLLLLCGCTVFFTHTHARTFSLRIFSKVYKWLWQALTILQIFVEHC